MLHRQPLVLVIFFAFVAITSSCRAPNRNTQRGVTTWGTMREVLRQGKSEGRVALANIATPHTIGVGALEGLAGEVTIVDGRVLVASATIGNDDANGVPLVRDATDTDRAALLVLADVPAWKEIELGVCGSYEELERAIAAQLQLRQVDLTDPTPIRVRGIAQQVDFHVIAGSCPIADPAGPAPWRHSCRSETVELIGFYVEGAAGRLTHHTHSSHLHVVAGDLMGHVDAVNLQNAVLLLPSK